MTSNDHLRSESAISEQVFGQVCDGGQKAIAFGQKKEFGGKYLGHLLSWALQILATSDMYRDLIP